MAGMCMAESDGPSQHRGTHICRTREPAHDKHRCAVCGYGWPLRGGAVSETGTCGHEYVLGGVAYGCERAPHSIDGYGPAFRHVAGIDAGLAEGTDEGDGRGPATLVTWGEDGQGEGQDWEIDWGTAGDYPGRSRWRGTDR